MTVKAEAFLALESALSKRLQVTLRALVSPVYKGIQRAMDALDYEEAERLVRTIRLGDLYEKNKAYVAYMTNLAMLFGASRVTTNPGTTVVGLGFEKNTSFNLAQVLGQSIGAKAEQYLIAQGLQVIAQHKEAQQATTKAEKTADPTNPTSKKPPRILRDFQTFMRDSGKAYLDIASSLHTSRVSAYGFTAEALALGIEEYQINEQLDNRICSVCAQMHGKRFKVRDARASLEVVTRVSDPDQLKLLQPWPKKNKATLEAITSMTHEELVGKNWHIPPFHPRCRGMLSRVGKVPELTPEKTFKPAPEAYVANDDDFTAMLLPKPSKVGVQHWNEKVKVAPLEVAAVMVGDTAERIMTDALLGEIRPALKVISSSKRVTVRAKRRVGSETMEHSIAFTGAEALVTIYSVPKAFGWKSYLLALYVLAQDSGAGKLEVVAQGAELSHLGFKVDGSKWVLDFTDKVAMASFLG